MAKESVVVFTFGRFQPPTKGHQRLIDVLEHVAAKEHASAALVFPSPIEGDEDNPLPFLDKAGWLERIFPHVIVNHNVQYRNPFLTLQALAREFDKVIAVVGDDQEVNFTRMGARLGLKSYRVIAVSRDAHSGTKLRNAVTAEDVTTFTRGIPSTVTIRQKFDLFKAVRRGLGIDEGQSISSLRDDAGGGAVAARSTGKSQGAARAGLQSKKRLAAESHGSGMRRHIRALISRHQRSV